MERSTVQIDHSDLDAFIYHKNSIDNTKIFNQSRKD